MVTQATPEIADPRTLLLDAADLPGISQYLLELGWLHPRESLLRAGRAGDGNMNCTLRIQTSERSVILKQARPWVEKYPHIAAPWDRTLSEGRFYREVQANSHLARQMPQLLAFDPRARVLLLEDLGESSDFTFLYKGQPASEGDLRLITRFLADLHRSFRGPGLAESHSNFAMRTLNHEHIFCLPMRADNGLQLDVITPGLSALARGLQANAAYRRQVAALGELYLSATRGSCLVHGDFFPGSWLKVADGVRIIDPEFSFWGPPEFDLGMMLAHLHIVDAGTPLLESVVKIYTAAASVDLQLTRRFAGVEIMRRLIGVAQLPVSHGLDEKRRLLDLSCSLVTE